MKNIDKIEAEQFKDPFYIESYIESLLSNSIITQKKFDENYATKVELVFNNTSQSLISLLNNINNNMKNLINSFKRIQNEFIQKSTVLTESVNNINNDLTKYVEKIHYFQNITNKFGKNIAIHDLAINRAKHLTILCEKFQNFVEDVPNTDLVPSDLDKLLKIFEIMQILKKVAEIIKHRQYQSLTHKIINFYMNVEKKVLDEFVGAFETQNIEKMKQIRLFVINSTTLELLYCTLIEHFQEVFDGSEIFDTQPSAVVRFSTLCNDAFNAEYKFLMNLYLQKLYEGGLKSYCKSKLDSGDEHFLDNLGDLYQNCINMQKQILKSCSNIDVSSIEYHQKIMFSPYLTKYFDHEIKYITATFNAVCEDVQIKKTISIQDAGFNMIHIARKSHKRCDMLSSRVNLAKNITKIFELLINTLVYNIMLNELESLLKDLTSHVFTNNLDIHFFEVTSQITTSMHLLVNYFNEYVVPATTSSTHFDSTSIVLKNAFSSIESKIDLCFDKYINVSVSILKSIICSKMPTKVLIYSGDDSSQHEDIPRVGKILKTFNNSIQTLLSPSNYRSFGIEFAMRFCRFLVQHYKEFSYSQEGAMIALVDIRVFRESFNTYNVKEIVETFDLISSLVNLFIVPADIVRNVARGDNLKKIDPQLIQAYVEKRKDYKVSNIGRIDK